MTTLTFTGQPAAAARRARNAARWIGLSASPACALMAWIAATDAPRIALCTAASDRPPIDGMAMMYLLMSLFHLSPWLTIAAGRPRPHTCPTPHNQGD
jgi:hypothetical protein